MIYMYIHIYALYLLWRFCFLLEGKNTNLATLTFHKTAGFLEVSHQPFASPTGGAVPETSPRKYHQAPVPSKN